MCFFFNIADSSAVTVNCCRKRNMLLGKDLRSLLGFAISVVFEFNRITPFTNVGLFRLECPFLRFPYNRIRNHYTY